VVFNYDNYNFLIWAHKYSGINPNSFVLKKKIPNSLPLIEKYCTMKKLQNFNKLFFLQEKTNAFHLKLE